ncbi:hypothetical protein N7491_009413 [Penicillium cf. griseofulvum]|nr:hypothetical protein N7491_009413 [Penicillium cf. griseofulvum]
MTINFRLVGAAAGNRTERTSLSVNIRMAAGHVVASSVSFQVGWWVSSLQIEPNASGCERAEDSRACVRSDVFCCEYAEGSKTCGGNILFPPREGIGYVLSVNSRKAAGRVVARPFSERIPGGILLSSFSFFHHVFSQCEEDGEENINPTNHVLSLS